MSVDPLLREAWLRAEAQCECTKQAHGHGQRCQQVLIWEERGGTGRGAWEVRQMHDPRVHPCQILCVVCYAKLTGRIPPGSS